jgi:hypothetical protein
MCTAEVCNTAVMIALPRMSQIRQTAPQMGVGLLPLAG